MHHRHHDSAEGTDTSCFNRRGNTTEEQAEHQEHKNERCNQIFVRSSFCFREMRSSTGTGGPSFGLNQLRIST